MYVPLTLGLPDVAELYKRNLGFPQSYTDVPLYPSVHANKASLISEVLHIHKEKSEGHNHQSH